MYSCKICKLVFIGQDYRNRHQNTAHIGGYNSFASKRARKEQNIQQYAKLLTLPILLKSERKSERPARLAKMSEGMIHDDLIRRVRWGLPVSREDIPLYLGGGEEYWM